MKRASSLFLTLALSFSLAIPAFADGLSFGGVLVATGILPAALIIGVVVLTALIIRERKNNKKK